MEVGYDTSRVLGISTNTVMSELKKKEFEIKQVNDKLLSQVNCEDLKVNIVPVQSAELDENVEFCAEKR